MGKDDALRFARNSTRPWLSLDSYSVCNRRRDDFIDSPEQILLCCNCSKAECDNCLSPNYSGGRLTKAREIFRKYFYEGLSKKEIINKMNISDRTYWRYVRRFIEEGE